MGSRQLIAIALLALTVGCARSGEGPDKVQAPAAVRDASRVAAAHAAAQPPQAGIGAASTQAREQKTLALSGADVAKLGIVTVQLQASAYAPQAEGFGVIVNHDLIAQALADLRTAAAALRQSRAALERGKRLADGPGALGADALELATRQVSADQAALALAQAKLTATFGNDFRRVAPEALASGGEKLARITFPAGSIAAAAPTRLRVGPLDLGAQTVSVQSKAIWDAPQDPTLPGRSYFVVLAPNRMPEGSRVRAWQVLARPGSGVVVPGEALVIAAGQYWVYVRTGDASFRRVAIDVSRPVTGGYFVADGLAPAAEVVIAAAGLLLAREMNASPAGGD